MKTGSFGGKCILFKLSRDTEKLNRQITFKLTENVAKRTISKMAKDLSHFYV